MVGTRALWAKNPEVQLGGAVYEERRLNGASKYYVKSSTCLTSYVIIYSFVVICYCPSPNYPGKWVESLSSGQTPEAYQRPGRTGNLKPGLGYFAHPSPNFTAGVKVQNFAAIFDHPIACETIWFRNMQQHIGKANLTLGAAMNVLYTPQFGV